MINKVYQEIKKEIESFGFLEVSHDFERPWDGYLIKGYINLEELNTLAQTLQASEYGQYLLNLRIK